jgi:hypothetical protein
MTQAQPEPWRGRINALTYGVELSRPVPDEDVARVAGNLVRQKVYTDPVEIYYEAALAALGSSTALAGSPAADANVRSFLSRLVDLLYTMQPWAEPAYRVVPDAEPAALGGRLIGRIAAGRLLVQQRTGILLQALTPAAEEFGAVLAMRSGATVALRATRAAAAAGVEVRSDAADPDAVRAEVQQATGLEVAPPA